MSKDERQQLGREIRRARRAKGLTQQQLADASGVGVRTIGKMERGIFPQERNTHSLRDVLDVLGLDSPEPPDVEPHEIDVETYYVIEREWVDRLEQHEQTKYVTGQIARFLRREI